MFVILTTARGEASRGRRPMSLGCPPSLLSGNTGRLNANGGTLNINHTGPCGAAVTNGSGGNSTGSINVAAGATLNWTLSNTNAGEAFRVQNGYRVKLINSELGAPVERLLASDHSLHIVLGLRDVEVFGMDLEYWDETLQNYDAEVVSVYDFDVDRVVSKLILQLARTCGNHSAADMGCGVGKFTQLLSSVYRRVESCDFSLEGLRLTRERCSGPKHININYHHIDLTSDPSPFNPVNLVLCINVLMMPSLDERLRGWRTVINQVRHQGHLLLVVPAVESILMERHWEIENQLDGGSSCRKSLKDTLPEHSTAMDFHQGVYIIDRARTKHYLKAELEAILEEHQFTIQQIHPLRYRRKGHAEMLDTWDWLILAERK